MNDKKTHYFDTKVLGQPSGLFFLFFTEMWERFSFYGMRVLLVQFLTAEILLGDPKGAGAGLPSKPPPSMVLMQCSCTSPLSWEES